MTLRGKLYAESPIYRGNARKTLFTRDGNGTQRLVSLAGEIEGTAESLMDAFIGSSRNGRNRGLLNQLWQRLFGSNMPEGLISRVTCSLSEQSYPRGNFFDLRMGLKLDEDRWAAEANANYKMETLYKNSVFDIALEVNDRLLQTGESADRLYQVLNELREGRFWFGAGKSRGLGRCRLEMEIPFQPEGAVASAQGGANHLTVSMSFDATNPVLVGWNWGKVDPDIPAFAAVEGRMLLGAMRNLPPSVRERLEMTIGGPILTPEAWKQQFAEFLPRTIAVLLREGSITEQESWVLPASAARKLGRGKYKLSKGLLTELDKCMDQPFPTEEALAEVVKEALGKKQNMLKRVMAEAEKSTRIVRQLNMEAWQEIASSLHLDPGLTDTLAQVIEDESRLAELLAQACKPVLSDLFQQMDRQIRLLQSDTWIDQEIADREQHLRIKQMLSDGQISEYQWGDPDQVPRGVSASAWREFLEIHRRVRYRHMLNQRNLQKSITNDRNFIAFLQTYRDRVRQELTQPHHTDFRTGGPANREVSREYGKPYDTLFMRMLSWAPSAAADGKWEVYIPGSTIKGAFRKRASQVLKTLWGDSRQTDELLGRLFGAQSRRGLLFFSDAYLMDPDDPERSWCSMDGVRMDPRTGRPIEAAKADYLFAYGSQLRFRFRIDLQDVRESDEEALSLFFRLIEDMRRGDIPLGGQKTSGLGWVKADLDGLQWRTTNPADISNTLFSGAELNRDGIWHVLQLEGEAAEDAFSSFQITPLRASQGSQHVPRASAGFVSHRAFGGNSGMLFLEAEVLTPTSIKESGEPSFQAALDGECVYGWDFFSMSPPEAAQRGQQRVYALPSKSLRGMVRHIYSIATDSRDESPDISRLNPADSLFGWVGQGPNQAIMGRPSFSFATFDDPQLAWLKIPYPYGQWQWGESGWREVADASARMLTIDDQWRVFLHTPLAPSIEQLDDFTPDTVQASYVRAMMPGSRCQFSVRFWNLEDHELQQLIWTLVLDDGMAHKIGRSRYLGMGSIRLRVLPASYLIDWNARYGGGSEEDWMLPLELNRWLTSGGIQHLESLRKALNARHL